MQVEADLSPHFLAKAQAQATRPLRSHHNVRRLIDDARRVIGSLRLAAQWPEVHFTRDLDEARRASESSQLEGLRAELRAVCGRLAREVLPHSTSVAAELTAAHERADAVIADVETLLREFGAVGAHVGRADARHDWLAPFQGDYPQRLEPAHEIFPTYFSSLPLREIERGRLWLSSAAAFQFSVLRDQAASSNLANARYRAAGYSLQQLRAGEVPLARGRAIVGAVYPALGHTLLGSSTLVHRLWLPETGAVVVLGAVPRPTDTLGGRRAVEAIRERLASRDWSDAISALPGGSAALAQVAFDARVSALIDRWELETGIHSSFTKRMRHESFRALLDLGPHAVGAILRHSIFLEPSWSVLALPELTGESPLLDEDRGKIGAVITRWVQWWEAMSKKIEISQRFEPAVST